MNASSAERFDAIIIGVGQSGKPLALALSEKGWKTAIIERKYLGGTCINYGCTPTKTMLASAEIAQLARRSSEFGVLVGEVEVNLKQIKQRKNSIVERFRKSIQDNFDLAEHLTLIHGEAYFVGNKLIEVALPEGGSRQLTADTICIDCGTSPSKPDFDGIDSISWLNSTSIMELEEVPEHLLILGGGYIGLEFGQMFRRFGSQVSMIERGHQLLSREDPDMAQEVAKILEAEGIKIYFNTTVKKTSTNTSGAIELQLITAGQSQSLKGSHLLAALGTTPNTKTLNLQATGVATNDKGYIQVNNTLETTQPGIYALGDIKGGPAFTHISYDDYRVMKQNLIGVGGASITDRYVPYTVFIDPQLAHIGIHEKEARKAGKSIKIASFHMKYVARAIETNQTQGLMKAIIDAQTNQILGATILSTQGGEIMSMIQIAMMGKLPYTQLRDGIFAHPTLAESLNSLFSKVE